ncbi:MAG TPA: aldose epimerase family protein [Saprospiraceae bacterium]|nr:aldose epimerase family protein [Saprospiraceae bacterium]
MQLYKRISFVVLSVLFLATACTRTTQQNDQKAMTPSVSIKSEPYGTMPNGQAVQQYTLSNEAGMSIDIITYGGIITSWTAPDQEGNFENIALGFDGLDQYLESSPYFGALIGRYGNRIAKGQFSLNGEEYQLATNDGPNHLHGGPKGFDKVLWTAKTSQDDSSASLILSYLSEDMEEGYPGNLNTTVTYTLTADNELRVAYEATTDKTTVVNLTQHTYFNLSGDFSEKILDHEVMINADTYLPVDETLIPNGELRPVDGTPFDFREAKAIGAEIGAQNTQLERGNGYDHCWVLNNQGGMRKVATAYHPESGRFLEISTDEPGIQFYTGNFLDGTLPVANGAGNYEFRTGFCLETQHYPDTPNQPDFPSVTLEPGETYQTTTSFKFSTK